MGGGVGRIRHELEMTSTFLNRTNRVGGCGGVEGWSGMLMRTTLNVQQIAGVCVHVTFRVIDVPNAFL